MPPTLLLADDSVTIQRVIELTFADEDITVIAVSDGDQAIAAMQQSRPDIVLVDAGMPGRNGYEVVEFMRRTPGLETIPVLLLTGAFEPIDQARAEAAGCGGVLVKPFEPQQVIARVQEVLTRPPGAPPAADVASPAPAESARPHQPPPSASVDEFFDRLDKALGAAAGAGSPDAPGAHEELQAWFAAKAVSSTASSAPRAAAPQPLHQAFLALLDTERAGAPAIGDGLQPSEMLVEAVAARVLERLSDQVVRSAVSDVVSAIAERLVQEEIDRIKAEAVRQERGA